MPKMNPPKILVLDVDGVLTDGTFWYSEEGKILKRFGPDDNDGIQLLSGKITVCAVSADKRGFPITQARVERDMKVPLSLVSSAERLKWMEERCSLADVCYMGDGIFDAPIMHRVGYSIAPADADPLARKVANYVTERPGGKRAVAEACLHLLETFFEPFEPIAGLGRWSDAGKKPV